MKREVASMMLRRFIVKKITQFPAFFSKFLKISLAHTYGHERRDPAEVDRLEREGKISADDAADERLPGPFSLVTFCQHLLQDKTWGDQHVLAILSCLWQIRITVLHAEDLTETRIRHDLPLPKTDLLLLFTGGNHFMGAGKCFLFYGLIIYPAGSLKVPMQQLILVLATGGYGLITTCYGLVQTGYRLFECRHQFCQGNCPFWLHAGCALIESTVR